jgi:ribosome-associated protein
VFPGGIFKRMIQTDNNLAELVAKAASDKKAGDIVIMDLTGISPVTDYFVVCSANSITQVQAIADNIEEQLREQGIRLLRREGYRDARWVLLDYGNCVAHIFVEEDRQFYKLERLWGDAKQVVYQG